MERVKRHQPRGSILMVVLWLMGILALVASAFAFHSRTELRLTAFQWDQQRLTQVAQKKAAQAATYIEKSSGPLTLEHIRRWDEELFPEQAGNRPLGGPRPEYLSDESSRINLNKVSQETLERLTGYREMAAAILDWRDPDSQVTSGGAENDYYQSLATPYPCRNGPFQSFAELVLIKGMTPELYQALLSKVTVVGDGKVNVHTAGEDVLEALGASTALINKTMVYRKGPDLLEGTADDGVFPKKSQVIELLEKRWPLNESEKASWQEIEREISVTGNALRLKISGTLDDSLSKRWYQIVIDPAEGGRPLRSWREGSGWGGL